MPCVHPAEVVSAIAEFPAGSENDDRFRAAVNDSDAGLPRNDIFYQNRRVSPAVAIEIAVKEL